MSRHRCLFVAIGLTFACAAVAGPAAAHDHTRRPFLQQRAVAQAKAQRQTEPAPSQGEKSCKLTIELSRANAAKPISGLVRITNLTSGKTVELKGEIAREAGWYAVESPVTLAVPQGELKIEALCGLEATLATREVDLAGREAHALKFELKTFYDPAARRLKSGNTHLHLMRMTHAEAVRYLQVVPRADNLDLVFLSHLRRDPEDRVYISNVFTDGDLKRLSTGGLLFGNGEEHRHNFGAGGEGYGHVMLLNILRLIEPVSIGPGIMKTGTDGIPLQRGIRAARQDDATIVWCHNAFGHEDIPNWVAGLIHAQNIHDGGTHGTYEDTFYRYLNIGMKVPFSTGTDWFIYDFSRVYVPLEGELTVEKWLAALTAGKSYITNSVFLEFQADGQAIGQTIAASKGHKLHITGRGLSRSDFGRLEVVHNGQVIHTARSQAADGHFVATVDHRVEVSGPGWIALRIPTGGGKNEFDKPLYAHTSPIYIEVDGQRLFRPDAARGLVDEMEKSRQFVASKGLFANDDEKDAVLSVYRSAIAMLQERIDAQLRDAD